MLEQPQTTHGIALWANPVARNNWTDLRVPKVGAWTPQLRVAVVIPAFECQAQLDRTLASLTCQTYPDELLQVIVVDDGSHPPLRLHDKHSNVSLLRLDRADDFGAGRARRAGAAASEAEILLFIDSDMVVSRHHVEGHARWHHLSPEAVTSGYRRFVDFEGITPALVAQAVSDGTIEQLLADRPSDSHEWVERFLARTNGLTRWRWDLFRQVVGADVGVSRSLHDEVGGFPAIGLRGVEDTTFGYRLAMAGAVFIPDDQVISWHQGTRTFSTAESKQIKRRRSGRMANEIPFPGFRPRARGRIWKVPAVQAIVRVKDEPFEIVARCVNSVLGSQYTDVQVTLVVPDPHSDVALLADAYHFDARVHSVGPSQAPLDGFPSPYTLELPAWSGLSDQSLDRLLLEADHHEVGLLHVVVPGAPVDDGLIRFWRTPTHRRARRHCTDAQAIEPLAGQLFGERWVDGQQIGVSHLGVDAVSQPEAASALLGENGDQGPAPSRDNGGRQAEVDELKRQLAEARGRIRALRQRRVVRFADRLGKLRPGR